MEASEVDQESALDKLKSTQSKERKALQAKIAGLKHAVTKNDKKKKKEVAELVESLEKELKDRHESEINALLKEEDSVTCVEAKLSQVSLNQDSPAENGKPTKAQLRREKKNETIKRKAAAAEMDEKNAETSLGRIEMDEIKRVLSSKGFVIIDIASDGDCLYNALADQVVRNQLGNYTGKDIRGLASRYMRKHADDFLPFLTNDADDSLSEFDFDEYCSKVERNSREGGDWGGEPEIRAISGALECKIEVVQPNGKIMSFGEDYKPSLMITYHRHAYLCGEHYNSTCWQEVSKEEEVVDESLKEEEASAELTKLERRKRKEERKKKRKLAQEDQEDV